MSDWDHTTKEVSFENLPSEMVSAINRHLELYNLGSSPSDALMCIQTDSEKVQKGPFDKVETVQMVAFVTHRWLVWAVSAAMIKAAVLSAQLIHVTVQDYAQTPFAEMVPDSGVKVHGMFTDASENASAFIGLDEGIAGKKFRELVIKAVQNAKQ